MKSQNQTGSSGPSLKRTDLDFALLESFDLMQRSLLDAVYVVAGDASRCLHDGKLLECSEIEFVIPGKHVTPEVVSMLKDYATKEIRTDGFDWSVNNVPLKFRFVYNEYDYFNFAYTRVYGPEVYRIPNQFNRYWEERENLQ